jgi:hypothetical protein
MATYTTFYSENDTDFASAAAASAAAAAASAAEAATAETNAETAETAAEAAQAAAEAAQAAAEAASADLDTTHFSAAALVTEADGIGSNDNDTTIPTSAAVKAYADSITPVIENLEVADFAASAIVTEAEGLASSDNDTSLPTTAAVKDYVDDNEVTPGGSDKQFQWNNAGSFGGANLWREGGNEVAKRNGTNAQTITNYNTYTDASNYERLALKGSIGSYVEVAAETAGTGADNLDLRLTPVGTGKVIVANALTVTGGTVTTSAPVIDLTQTWNSSGVAFTGIKGNFTNTASAVLSKLIDLQVGGSTVFASGYKAAGDPAIWLLSGSAITASNYFALYDGSDTFIQSIGSGNLHLGGTADGWGLLAVYAAGNVRIGSATTFGWASASSTNDPLDTLLARDAAGVIAQRNSTNSQTFRLYNTYTDGSNYERGALQWTSGDLELIAQTAGTGTDDIDIRLTPAGSGTVIVPQGTSSAPSIRLGASGAKIHGDGGDNAFKVISGGGVTILSIQRDDRFSFAPEGTMHLYVPIDGILEQRNSTNSQTFRLYNTYTDGSNYERLTLDAGSGFVRLRAETAGTGTDNININLTPAGTGAVVLPNGSATNPSLKFGDAYMYASGGIGFVSFGDTNAAAVAADGTSGLAVAANMPFGWSSGNNATAAIADTRLYRGAAGIINVRANSTSAGAALNFAEQTAPSAPSSNQVVFYAEDNGSGKTRLMALFPTGAAQQVAIEP